MASNIMRKIIIISLYLRKEKILLNSNKGQMRIKKIDSLTWKKKKKILSKISEHRRFLLIISKKNSLKNVL